MHEATLTNTTFDDLRHRMANCPPLATGTNPVVRLLRSRSLGSMVIAADYVLAQYSQFPGRIVQLLDTSRSRLLADADAASLPNNLLEELTRNIKEELGSKTAGVSHFQLLCDGLAATLDLSPEAHSPQAATEAFLAKLAALCGSSDPIRSIGSVYAMELTAKPELNVVRHIYRHRTSAIAREVRLNPRWISADASIERFFWSHIQIWEHSHELELRKILEPELGRSFSAQPFEAGFAEVLEAMCTWWSELEAEACLL